MSTSVNRTVRTALIPWVFAIVALFGLNALAPDHSLSKKSDSPDEIGLSQLPQNAQTPGRIFNPHVFLEHAPSDRIGFLNSSSLFLCIETRRDHPLLQSPGGAVQGRAPPEASLS